MMKIAVFASGNGSNFEAIQQAIIEERLDAEIAMLVSDQPDCYAIERAKNHHIEIFSFFAKDYPAKEVYELEITRLLKEKNIELIVLAGYMRIIGPVLMSHFENRIINIHPSLLPAFPGLHAIDQAYQYGVKVFGVTIHYVDTGIDTGKIIAQDCFHVNEGETIEEVETRIHQLEHQLYPETIQKIINTTLCKKK
ncbi:phosphoribosylglycinamide formyltransferase [Bacteroidales bacterium OttesenSCG-928-B11]|nr:phosphoribosylglycinamide formyltransferase [Bacteroidales bacterium OttesenSCG-928-C03]MDL2312142.1 phosphoribosylglycinamide formyltransferase [Bacteroidales bacterium OttesenSCG-928-B11]